MFHMNEVLAVHVSTERRRGINQA